MSQGANRTRDGARKLALGQFRAHPRKSAKLRALVTHVQHGWQLHADVVNLGLGGACLLFEARVSEGDIVTLSFTAPTLWDPLVVRATVVWSESAPAAVSPSPSPSPMSPHPFPQSPAPASNAVRMHGGVAFDYTDATAVFALFELASTISYE